MLLLLLFIWGVAMIYFAEVRPKMLEVDRERKRDEALYGPFPSGRASG